MVVLSKTLSKGLSLRWDETIDPSCLLSSMAICIATSAPCTSALIRISFLSSVLGQLVAYLTTFLASLSTTLHFASGAPCAIFTVTTRKRWSGNDSRCNTVFVCICAVSC